MSGDTIATYDHEELIDVSLWTLTLAAIPLLIISCCSWYLDIGIESPLLIGTIRSFVQLSILGLILTPIFIEGETLWQLVFLYVAFMIMLSAYESTKRCKYRFQHMFWYALALILTNVTIVSLFAFGLILRPDPLWNPQYVIRESGLLYWIVLVLISFSSCLLPISYVRDVTWKLHYRRFAVSQCNLDLSFRIVEGN